MYRVLAHKDSKATKGSAKKKSMTLTASSAEVGDSKDLERERDDSVHDKVHDSDFWD